MKHIDQDFPPCVSCVFRGTIDDCELVDGLVLTQRVANSSVSRVEKAKIGLIQFCLSPPKTDVSLAGKIPVFLPFLSFHVGDELRNMSGTLHHQSDL